MIAGYPRELSRVDVPRRAYSQPPAPREIPEWHEPAATDRMGQRRGGLRARAGLAVYQDERGEWVLDGLVKSPWNTVVDAWGQDIIKWAFVQAVDSFTSTSDRQYTVADVNGTDRTLEPANESTGPNIWDSILTSPEHRYGSDGTAEDGSSTSLGTLLETISLDDITVDDTANTITSDASHVSSSTDTIREVAYIGNFDDTGGTDRPFLVDRTVVGDTSVSDGDTVGITYVWDSS